MKGSKLIALLQKLDRKQVRRFVDFAESPYFNKRDDVRKFVRKLAVLYPDFADAQIEKHPFYRQLYPDKPFDEKHLGYLMSWSLKLAESFIVVEHTMTDTLESSLKLLETLSDWNLDKHYRSLSKRVEKERQQNQQQDAQYFLSSFKFDSIRNAHFDRKRQHVPDDSLTQASENLDAFYLSQKLRYSCELLNRRQWVSGGREIDLLPELLTYLDGKDFSGKPAIAVYQQIHLCLTEPEKEQHFVGLREQLASLKEQFTFNETRDVFAYAFNYCIGQINKGRKEYHGELLNLYKLALDRKLLFDNGLLSPWSYKNIVSVACRSGELDWADGFIKLYKDNIPLSFRENAFAYNQAYLLFNREAYQDALSLLQQVEFTDLYYALDSKTVLLKIYFELQEWTPLRSLLNAFRIYLKRNKQVSEGLRGLYLNLIGVTRELMNDLSGYGKRTVEYGALQERVATMAVADKQWLLEKIKVGVEA